MNPFANINPYLHEFVLQHFSGNEIIKTVSLVSPEWCEIAGKSKVSMNKVKFLYQVWRHQFYSSTEVFQTAACSWREYQHVIVELGVNDDLRQFWRFMESCCKSVVTLRVDNVRRFGDLEDFEFPNLETFRAFTIDEKSLTTFLKTTEKLRDLFVFSGETTLEQSLIDELIKCLERNPKLEDLYLKNAGFLRIFDDELCVKFHLKSLKLLSTSVSSSLSPNAEENLLRLLQHCGSHLETFFFEFSNSKIEETAFTLPALSSLGLLTASSSDLVKNFKIKTLEIPFVEDFPSVKKLVDASPNVESLFVANVNNELVEYLAWNFMKLTSLNFKMISLESEEFYEKLKREHAEVNQAIDIWDYENVDWE
jgi:hypothetical protein